MGAVLPMVLHLTQLSMGLHLQLLPLLLQLQLLHQHQLLLELATMVLLLASLMRSLETSRMVLSVQQRVVLTLTAQLISLQVPSPQWQAAPSRMRVAHHIAPWSADCLPVIAELVPHAVTLLMVCATGLVPSRPPTRPSSLPSLWLSELKILKAIHSVW